MCLCCLHVCFLILLMSFGLEIYHFKFKETCLITLSEVSHLITFKEESPREFSRIHTINDITFLSILKISHIINFFIK